MNQDNQWVSGKSSAGAQAQNIKKNLQINSNSQLYQQLSQQYLQQIKESLLIQFFCIT